MNNKTYYQLYGITLLGLVELTIFLQTAQWNFTAAIIKEGGLVESLSALGHFIGVILLGLIRRKPTSYLYGMFFCFSSD